MFGLITIKEHDRRFRNFKTWYDIKKEERKKDKLEIIDLKKSLELEKVKSLYWKQKCLHPDVEPIILSSEEDLSYIMN